MMNAHPGPEPVDRPASGDALSTSSGVGLVGPVEVGPIAHGGHCVARHEGRVIFVRHALPGEQVMINITDDSKKSFWRGDATEIRQPSPDRVDAPCPISGPGACGGCDFQHVDLAAQRELKAAVLTEQLQRLAGIDLHVPVEPVDVPGRDADDGRGWRTRMRYQHDDQGRVGLRAHRSHRVVALPAEGCLIAAPAIAKGPAPVEGSISQPELIGVAAADGPHWLSPEDRTKITEHAIGRDWQVAGDGFWQVHPAAAEVLAGAVLDGLDPQPGERALDLYCGVGLFAGPLLDRGCRVTGVESDRQAVALARSNLADAGSDARFVAARVDRALNQPRGRGSLPGRVELVVLDPPRSGAGKKVVEHISRRRPRAIAYVACDPAALARDLGYFADQGYRLESLRAFDLFPMTHHLECVAILHPVGASPRR
jgi:tRNA/tmRNA/rRNA uracil-C5-methylase (TrmA/RlmC/RlmD family)